MDYVDLGNRIRRQRKQLGWTQEEMAERANVCTSFIGHIERGTRKASLETLVAIATVLNLSLDYLMAGSLQRNTLNEMIPQSLNANQREALQKMIIAFQDSLIS